MTSTEPSDIALDPDLMAYVDGCLEPEKRAAVEARLARDAEARDAIAQWRHMNNLLNDFAQSADTLPPDLKTAALERELLSKLRKQRWRTVMLTGAWRQVAAGLVFFVAGWGSHAIYTTGSAALDIAAFPDFVTPTLAGHAAYTLAADTDSIFADADMTAALDWMSERMQYKLESPKLERLGYQVESARLMRAGDHPVAVFYYRNSEDQRVTVSISPKRGDQRSHALRVVDVDNAVMAYWSSGDLHYAIVANDKPSAVTTLAAAVEQ